MSHEATHRAIHAIWKFEAPKLIASLARVVRDVGLAEELAQDAFVIALERWPDAGVPDNPGAWLMTTAKRRAINEVHRGKLIERKHDELAHVAPPAFDPAPDTREDDLGDDLLPLMFIACHPALAHDAQVALTLRMLGGLTTDEIARAFLVREPTIAQRIVRAKRTLAEARVPFELPPAGERAARLTSVLEVLYLIFNEGYSANAGDDPMRPALCDEAMRLGRVLTHLSPDEAEVHALVALMELHASRSAARVAPNGDAVLLPDQNRALWDRLLIRRGLAALERADTLSATRGPYALQAALSACHARATDAAQTDWRQIASLYEQLAQLRPSPVVELNRAMAIAMVDGPSAGLALIDRLSSQPQLAAYQWLPSARADLLSKLERWSEAADEFARAATLAGNARDKRQLLEQAAACRDKQAARR